MPTSVHNLGPLPCELKPIMSGPPGTYRGSISEAWRCRLLDQGPIVSLEKQEHIACERLRTLARAPQTLAKGRGFDLWRAKAGSNLLRPSVIRLHRGGRPAISV